MENLASTNKEIRKEIKMLKIEMAALNGIYCELLEFIPSGQEEAIIRETTKKLIQQIGEQTIQRYYKRNAERMSFGRLEFNLLRILKENNST